MNGRTGLSGREEVIEQHDGRFRQDVIHAGSQVFAGEIDNTYVSETYRNGLTGQGNGQDLFDMQTRCVNGDGADVRQRNCIRNRKTQVCENNSSYAYISDFRARKPLASEHGGGAFMRRSMRG